MRIRFPGLERVDPRGNPRLLRALADRIAAEGPLTFADFMDTALYDPAEGYYVQRAGVGRTGDFLTSPELHPAFGAAIAEQLVELWEALEKPDPFVVHEPGAGHLRLARQITDWLGPRCPLQYVASDLREVEEVPEGVEYTTGSLPSRGRAREGVVLTNELLDAFGVHRLRFDGSGWLEQCVDYQDDTFVWTERHPTVPPPQLENVAPGQTVEVNMRAQRWIESIAESIDRGFILTFDYGGLAHEIYRPDRAGGTVRCFARHGVHDDPFRYVGEQDLTADVDFTALIDAGTRAGLSVAGFTTQRDFLLRWGFDAILSSLDGDTDTNVMNRQPLEHLVRADGLGRVRVLLQAKGVAPRPLLAFGGGIDRPRLGPGVYPALEAPNPFAPLM